MSSEQLADGVNPLDAELAATWDVLKGYSGRDTDLGIARRFGGATAAYSLRDIGAMNGSVVKVRRDVDGDGTDKEEDFSANQVSSGALEDWVNGKLEVTLPADVDTAAAAYSLRKVSEGRLIYTGDYSSDTNNISANSTDLTVTGNNDGIFTKSDVLKIENDGQSVPQLQTDAGFYRTSKNGIVEFEYYVPSDHPIVGNYWHIGTAASGGQEIAYTKKGAKIVGGAWTTAKLFYGEKFGGSDKATGVSDGQRLITILNKEISDGIVSLVNAEDGDIYYISSLTIKLGIDDVVRIRRSSDNIEVEVGFDSDDKISSSSPVSNRTEEGRVNLGDTTATTLGGFLTEGGTNYDAFVHTWYDQAGVNDAVQTSAAEQPQIASSGALLTDGIEFDGTNDRLVSSDGVSVTTTTDISFNLVGESDNITTTQTILSQKSGTGQGRSWTDIISSNFRSSIGGSAKTFGSVGSNGTQFLFTYILDESANTADAFNNSAQSGSQQTVNNAEAADGEIVIGCNNGESGQFLNGHLKEVIIYTSDQTDNRFKIESNINNYYGLYTFQGDGFVETWYDQSSNLRDAIQGSATNQPKIVSSGSLITVNSKPAITFDGNDNFLEVDGTGSAEAYSFSPSGDFGMFVVYKASVGNIIDSRDAGSDGIFLQQSSGTDTRFRYNGDGSINIVATNDEQHFNTMTLDGTTLSASVDGGTAGTDTVTAGVSTTQNLVLGAGFNQANATNGEIQEAIFYKNNKTSDKANIESDIDNFYSIT